MMIDHMNEFGPAGGHLPDGFEDDAQPEGGITLGQSPEGMQGRTKKFTLEGWLQWTGSKMGVRYFGMNCMEPYPHSLFLEVYGDVGRTDDDDINEDLSRIKPDEKQAITFFLSDQFKPMTTPSNIERAQTQGEL